MDNKTITMPYSEYKELLEEAHGIIYKKFGKTEEEIKNMISEANVIERSFEEKQATDKAINDLVSMNCRLKERNRYLVKENIKLQEQLESLKSKKWYQS